MTHNPPPTSPNNSLADQLAAAAAALRSFVIVVNAAAHNIHQASQSVSGNAAAGSQGAAGTTSGGNTNLRSLASSVGRRMALARAGQAGMQAAGQALKGGAGIGGATAAGMRGAAGTFGGGAAGGLALAAVAAVEVASKLNQLSKSAQEFNRHLAYASPQMAAANAQRDLQQRLRDREVGDRLSDSARSLNEAEQRKLESRKEIDVAWDRTKNQIATGWENFKAGFYRELSKPFKALNQIAENTDPNRPLAADEWAEKMAAEDRKWRDDWHRRHDHWEPVSGDSGGSVGVGGGDAFK